MQNVASWAAILVWAILASHRDRTLLDIVVGNVASHEDAWAYAVSWVLCGGVIEGLAIRHLVHVASDGGVILRAVWGDVPSGLHVRLLVEVAHCDSVERRYAAVGLLEEFRLLIGAYELVAIVLEPQTVLGTVLYGRHGILVIDVLIGVVLHLLHRLLASVDRAVDLVGIGYASSKASQVRSGGNSANGGCLAELAFQLGLLFASAVE